MDAINNGSLEVDDVLSKSAVRGGQSTLTAAHAVGSSCHSYCSATMSSSQIQKPTRKLALPSIIQLATAICRKLDLADNSSTKRLTYGELWRLGGLTPWRLGYRSFNGFFENHLDARAAQFAYNALMTIAPLLIVVIALVAQLPIDGVLESFITAIDVGMPENVVTLIDQQIQDIQDQSTFGLIAIGLFLLGFIGSRVFLALGAGLDAAYEIKDGRHLWKQSLLALLMTLGVLFLLLISMILLVWGPMVLSFLATKLSWFESPRVQFWLSSGIRWSIASLFLLTSATFIYWIVPGRKMPWYWLSPGNVFATVGWVAVTQGFQMYVENFGRYNETYGALGGVVVLLIWLYFTGFMLLMGGQINSVIENAATERAT